MRSALDALISLTTIEFDYLNLQGVAQKRQLQVYGVQARKSHWYLIGLDTEKGAIRNFRVDRIHGAVTTFGKSQSYAIPENFEITELEPAIETPVAVLQVRPGAGYQLRRMATTIETSDDWDLLELPIFDLDFITNLVLWHGEDVIVSSPVQLRNSVISALEQVVKIHG